jgi:hypothetical protein
MDMPAEASYFANWRPWTDRGAEGEMTVTEAEWLACTDPRPMLAFLRSKASGRKLSWFAVACCRKDRLLMKDHRSRQAIEWTERLIEGLAGDDDSDAPSDGDCYLMAAAANHCMAVAWRAGDGDTEAAGQYVRWVIEGVSESSQNTGVALRGHAALLRCVFGNPFCPVALDSSWLAWNDGTVVKLAQGIYEERAFDRLPVLADALEDVGCSDLDILGHCRSGGEHVRGCWVIDLLLGKS